MGLLEKTTLHTNLSAALEFSSVAAAYMPGREGG